MRADTYLARLDAASFTYAPLQETRAIVKSLLEPFRSMASPLLLADSLDIELLCVGFMKLEFSGKAGPVVLSVSPIVQLPAWPCP